MGRESASTILPTMLIHGTKDAMILVARGRESPAALFQHV